jgi:concanavalin A-like lectin/glucanase superfamily protein
MNIAAFSLFVLIILSGLFLAIVRYNGEADGYTEQHLGDVSTSVLTLGFEEDYEYDSSNTQMVYEATYSYSYGNVDSLSDGTTNTVYDLSANQNDGELDAGPCEQYNADTFIHQKHDAPRRTHTAVYGRAIDFWRHPAEKYPSVSDCRYVSIEHDTSLRLARSTSQSTYNSYDFELNVWPYEVSTPGWDRVLLCNLWSYNAYLGAPIQVEGWYNIGLNSNNQVIFQYPSQNLGGYQVNRITSTMTIDYHEWTRLNVRLTIGDNEVDIEFYKDGKFVDSPSMTWMPSFPIPDNDRLYTIGADPYSDSFLESGSECKQFYGLIDEVKIDKTICEMEDGSDMDKIGRQLFFIDFDEQGGDVLQDQTRNSFDGFIYGTSSKWGTAGDVYGGYINCQSNTYYGIVNNDADLHAQELTLEAWVYPKLDWDQNLPPTEHSNIVSKAYYGNQQPYYSFHMKVNKNRNVIFGVGGTSPAQDCAVNSNTAIPAGEWSHVAGSFKDGVAKIYINGVLKNTATYSWSGRSIAYNNLPVRIGNYHYRDNLNFPGRIDQVGMYDYAETFSPEITRLEFEDGSGATAADWTPFGNNGAITNAQFVTSGKYNEAIQFASGYTNPRVSIGVGTSQSDPDYLDGDFTVDCWVEPSTSLSGPSVVASQYNSWELGMTSDKYPYFKVKETGGSWVTATLPTPIIGDYNDDGEYDSWHHLMGVFNGDQVQVFLDGKGGYGDTSTTDATQSFTGYTRSVSTNSVYLALRYTGSLYQDQYYGKIDSFRLRKGAYDLTEDVDGDGMPDRYEIIRSLHSHQFDPFEHNSRFAILMSGLSSNSDYIFEERFFKVESYNMREVLVQQGYDDDDIIYLDNDDWFTQSGSTQNFGQSHFYENGDWIDGDCTIDNVQTTFGGLCNGGNITLESPHSSPSGPGYQTDIRAVTNLDEEDFFYYESNSHGGRIPDQYGYRSYFGYSQQGPTFPLHTTSTAYDSVAFRTDLNSISSKQQLVVISACYSDNFINGYYTIQTGTNVILRAVVTSDNSGQLAEICDLSWSYRIRGNSTSYWEHDNGLADPSDARYSGGTSNMIKHIKWGYNADDIEEDGWVIDTNTVVLPHVVFTYKEVNTRNIIVSAQEAYNYAKMWNEFKRDQATNYNYLGPGADFSQNEIPDEMVV